MRDLKKSNEPVRPIDSVALVSTTVGVLSNSDSRKIGPTSIGAAANSSRCRPRRDALRSTQ